MVYTRALGYYSRYTLESRYYRYYYYSCSLIDIYISDSSLSNLKGLLSNILGTTSLMLIPLWKVYKRLLFPLVL